MPDYVAEALILIFRAEPSLLNAQRGQLGNEI